MGGRMKCEYCDNDFEEKDLHESHDVPTYLWEGNRKGRKNQADKFGRHWLCKNCHDEYERKIRIHLRDCAIRFVYFYFLKVGKNGDSISKI